MMPKITLPLSLLLFLLPLPGAVAQDVLDIEAPELRRYAVEVIVFRYAQEVSAGSELFLAEKSAQEDPDRNAEPFLIDGEPLEEIHPVSRVYRDVDFTLLDEEEYTMGDILSRLERLDVYEPLMHFAWAQSTWPDEDTRPIDLSMMGTPPPGLGGTLRLYLSRYLHLVVDLQLDAPEEAQTANGSADEGLSYGDYRAIDPFGNASGSSREPYEVAPRPPLRYRIEENRILRSGELRYFDHPKFGVLARVVRVEDETDAADDTELLGYPAE